MQSPATLSKVFLPVIEATLTKREETPEVLVPALLALSHLLTAGLLPAAPFLSPLRAPLPALRLLLHRSTAVRGAAVALVAELAASLDVADLFALLAPALQAALGLRTLPDLNPLLFSERTVVRCPATWVTAAYSGACQRWCLLSRRSRHRWPNLDSFIFTHEDAGFRKSAFPQLCREVHSLSQKFVCH